MHILVTGAAGFIGYHVSTALLARGDSVVGLDNMNDYYDPALKQARLDQLLPQAAFEFVKGDIVDKDFIDDLFEKHNFDMVVHLAAQAGVRYSLENPHSYIDSNICGHLNILEACRHSENLKHLVYASSSSVYGGNTKKPFSVEDKVDHPVSLYAATKKADELMSYCYSHLYQIPSTGLRFFTVYGPWGRPDMAYYLFTNAIVNGKPINVFNHGKMKRNFTYIDDIVNGVLLAMDNIPEADDRDVQHKIYNLGSAKSEKLDDYIEEIEKSLGQKAERNLMDLQQGDVPETVADIEETTKDLGYSPKTPIEIGIPLFIDWYKEYHKIA